MIEDMNKADLSGVKRIIAVHATGNDVNSIVDVALEDMLYDIGEVVVFAPASMKRPANRPNNVSEDRWINFPEIVDSLPKQKNFIIDWCKSRNFNGFLHIMETSTKLNLKSKTYIDKLESTMTAFDYDIHFSTATDRCNYVFNKFCPRMTLDIDDDSIKQQLNLPDKIYFTSHSNISYVTYNFNALNECLPKFDERFTIGMFFIIEFLARRRSLKREDQLYYMNQYMSINDEIGGYDIIDQKSNNDDASKMQKENELFKSLNIDYAPDNNIDLVLDAFYKKLKSKVK